MGEEESNPTSLAILAESGLFDEPRWTELIQVYRGYPLALKIIARTIHDLGFTCIHGDMILQLIWINAFEA